jgi:hypothetical protein
MQLRKLSNKKGSIQDVLFVIIALLGLSIFILIVAYVFPQIYTQIQASPIGNNTDANQALNKGISIAGSLDKIFLIIFVGLTIALMVTSYNIYSKPALIPIYIIILAIMITISAVAQYVYQRFTDGTVFETVGAAQQIINYTMNNLILISLGLGVLSFILIFAKPAGSENAY